MAFSSPQSKGEPVWASEREQCAGFNAAKEQQTDIPNNRPNLPARYQALVPGMTAPA